MFIILLFIWLVLIPFPTIAQTDTPTPTEVPTVTPTESPSPTPIPTETPVPGPSATPTSAPASSTSTSAPTPKPTVKVPAKQTSNSQGGLFGGDGLAEDKEADTGLGFDKDNVQGAASPRELDSTGDKDLLSTLIFLTGAVVLVVWTVYMILIQKGIIKSNVKKSTPKGGITPQPLQ